MKSNNDSLVGKELKRSTKVFDHKGFLDWTDLGSKCINVNNFYNCLSSSDCLFSCNKGPSCGVNISHSVNVTGETINILCTRNPPVGRLELIERCYTFRQGDWSPYCLKGISSPKMGGSPFVCTQVTHKVDRM